ncbi:MAG: cytochrome c oxidase assembly protein [Alphaproteobacteria bacterium]|nr:MAG: cytochrome c oxidase assembly protein [Alphaproteobacteria bacterium]
MKRALALSLLLLPAPALAHGGENHWTLAPAVTLPLVLAALLYALGLARLWRRADRGRPALLRRALCYAAGWLALAGALVSPLHEAGEKSFTMHMIEHEILMLLAALLLVAARPGAALLWAFPQPVRAVLAPAGHWRLWRALADPFVATAIQAVAIIAWHMPWLFDLALTGEGWHAAQHLSFIASALLFWWAMLQGRAGPFVAALCLFATSMIGGGLGALMALASSPWYSAYAALGMTPAGLTPAEDQQLAGLIMWVPGGAWHLAAALWFLMRGLNRMEAGHALPR